MVNPSNSNINYDPNNRSVYRNQPAKNFEKVTRKDRQEERQKDSGKKFKPVDESDVKAKEEFEDAVAAAKETDMKPHSTIFDVEAESIGEGEDEEEATVKEMPPEMHKGSLSALFEGLGTKEKLAKMQKQVNSEKTEDLSEEKLNISSVFAREQPDLTSVNPIANLQTNSIEGTKGTSTPLRTNTVEMQELIDEMVKQLTIVSAEGKTDTTITLKHPPLFAGASLTVTTEASAKGQFNITFENLTQVAQKMIDMSENRNALRNSLEQKGYMVHIIVATTTQAENRQVVKDQPLGDQRGDQGQRQRRDDKEENEG